MKCPVVLLDIDSPEHSANMIKKSHLKEMYRSVVLELSSCVAFTTASWGSQIIRMDGERGQAVRRWLGSERYLLRYAEALASRMRSYNMYAGRNHRSMNYINEDRIWDGSNKKPKWMDQPTVLKKWKAQLGRWENLFRLNERARRRRSGRLYPYSSFYNFASATCTEVKPEHFNGGKLYEAFRAARLYQISWNAFLNRNHYSRYMPYDYLSERTIVGTRQCVAGDGAILNMKERRELIGIN